jgi:hypothetical protein
VRGTVPVTGCSSCARTFLTVRASQAELERQEKYPNLLNPTRLKSLMVCSRNTTLSGRVCRAALPTPLLQGIKVAFIAAGSAAVHCIIGDMNGNCFTWGRNEASNHDPFLRDYYDSRLCGRQCGVLNKQASEQYIQHGRQPKQRIQQLRERVPAQNGLGSAGNVICISRLVPASYILHLHLL